MGLSDYLLFIKLIMNTDLGSNIVSSFRYELIIQYGNYTCPWPRQDLPSPITSRERRFAWTMAMSWGKPYSARRYPDSRFIVQRVFIHQALQVNNEHHDLTGNRWVPQRQSVSLDRRPNTDTDYYVPILSSGAVLWRYLGLKEWRADGGPHFQANSDII